MSSSNEWLTQSVAHSSVKPKSDLSNDPDVAGVEVWLQKFGVSYSHLLELPLVNINEKKSRQNQARPTAVVSDSVDRFVLALKNGNSLPPVVGYKSGTQVVLIDGNNRDAAHRKVPGLTTIRAFIVHPDTASEIIHAMTVDANSNHGVTPELSWRIQQAIYLGSLGFDVEQACDYAKVTAKQYGEHQRAIRAEQRAKNLKIHGFSDLPISTKIKLGVLPSDPVFLQASRVVIDTKMTLGETESFVRELKACATEASQVACVGRMADSRKMAEKARQALGRPVQFKSVKTGLLTGLGKIMHADIGAISRQILTDIERAEMMKRLNEAGERLIEIQIAIENSLREETRNVG